MRQVLLLFFLGFIFETGISQKLVEKDFKYVFDRYGVEGCFVLYNETDQEFIKYHADLCDTGYIPASTFKIPNSLIALQEGVVKDTSQLIRWDGKEWPNKPWNQDQTLKTAMKYSCVWVYVGFAELIGLEKYQEYLDAFDYGNKNLAGPPTRFWLAGLLRISANQQIDFLRKFYHYELPAISRQSIDMVKNIMIIEKNDHCILSGKTGGGMLTDSEYIMWLVGYLERDDKTYYYALNFKSNDFAGTSQARYQIAKDIFKELRLME